MATNMIAITSIKNRLPGSPVMYCIEPTMVLASPIPSEIRIGNTKIDLMFMSK